jgi:hypothetical protein
MTRLSCRRFGTKKMRLWLRVIACDLANLWQWPALPGDHLVADHFAQRPLAQTRPLLLVSAAESYLTAVCRDAG